VNFLNVGPWELAVILIIAILLVGPKRMVEIARSIGRTTSQMRRLSSEFLGTIHTELETAEQETREALEHIAEGGQESVAGIPDEVQATGQETRQALEGIGEERREAATSIKAELQAIEHETRQAMKEIAEDVEGIVKGEKAANEGRDEEASSEQPG
jgi:Sec-independent protein translocase protein TatA